MDAFAESGKNKRISRVSTINRFSLCVGNEKADAGRDGQTCLVDPTLWRKRGNGKIIFPVPLATSRIGNRTQLMVNLVNAITSSNTTCSFCCCTRLLYPHYAPRTPLLLRSAPGNDALCNKVTPELVQELRDFFAPHNSQLEEILGRPLPESWSTSYRA